MTLEAQVVAQVKVFSPDLASFGGVKLRRVTVTVSGQPYQLLLHELGRPAAYVVSSGAPSTSLPLPLLMKAEWGEPLGQIQHLTIDQVSGEVRTYSLLLRLRNGEKTEVVIEASQAFWWNGELYCGKRVASQLREVQRGRPAPRSKSSAA